ncbi:MAG TPA: amidohydrolase family protein [Candidatus Latescibacteria bacterium]|jgi:predicted TIM-barrel fold metal-dependent hydrolase|nr:amidohydrolase family protein [Candidatus Latescibacterota bacterium]HJP29086.1 amidohydrolase family protein [Candidatus Latescibacterota bacterium]|tara:strand:+ start:93 stop:935 length:843 start_codon:yes stop_codon:yes gene_type:complete
MNDTPIINASEHAWTLHDPRFAIDPEVSACPNSTPDCEQTGETLIARMLEYGVDRTVISHVCYYGRNNDYPIHCVQQWPDRFAAIGLLVGHRLHPAQDGEANAERLRQLVTIGGLAGLRLSPIYDRTTRWLDDPACDPLWEAAADLGATFNLFLGPEHLEQLGAMAERHPGVNVVIDHFAMIDISRPDAEGIDLITDLARWPNVYMRTSLHNPSKESRPPFGDMWPYLRRAYDAFGPRRLLWGNYYEYLIMAEMIDFFTTEDRRWILGGTAEKLYFGQRR